MYGSVNVPSRTIKCVHWALRKLAHSVLVRTEVLLTYTAKVESERENVCEVLCHENVSENISPTSPWMQVGPTNLQKNYHAPSTHSYTVKKLSALPTSIFTDKEATSHIQSRNMAFFGTKRDLHFKSRLYCLVCLALSSLKADSIQIVSSNYERFCLLDRLHSTLGSRGFVS